MRLPYPGLRPFQRDESDLFFGREGCVDEMVRRLAATRFLAVLGTSGSGKSSLVMTGLLDALELGLHARAGSRWRIAYLRPGGRATENLARALLNASEPTTAPSDADIDMLATFLKRGPRSVTEWCRDGNLPPGTNLLILVDQFEELFRYGDYAGREEAEAFVALLLESSRDPDSAVNVTITMRSEYLGTCALIPGLAERINAGLYLVPRMSREEVRSAIEGPAAVCGFSIEPALVNRLLNDLATLAPWEDDRDGDQLQRLSRRADQLPLMQHVLNRIWLRAAETAGSAQVRLLLDDYTNLGGLTGALDAHAGEVFNGLPAADRPVAETVFRALISGTSVANAVRLPSRFDTLITIADGNRAAVARVVEAFRASGCNFLMPPPSMPLEDETIVDISHESLIRQWSLLRNWVRAEFQSAETYRHIETSAELWKEHRSGLLSMPYLGVALTWQREQRPNAAWAERRHRGDFTLAMNFLDTSGKRYRQGRLRTRAALVAGVMALVVALAAFAYVQTQKAKDREEALQQAKNDLTRARQELATANTKLKDTNLADELTDFGVQPQDALRTDVGSNTPRTIPGGIVVSTKDLGDILDRRPAPFLIDTLAGFHAYTIPDAVSMAFAADAGDWHDDVERRVKVRLDNLTDGNLDQPLVFFCEGARCWESYNASLRAIHAGYRHVYWYRGGIDAWQAAGFQTDNILHEAMDLQTGLSEPTGTTTRRRWALAATLSEIGDNLVVNKMLVDSALSAEGVALDELRTLQPSFPNNADFLTDLILADLRMGSAFAAVNKSENATAAYHDAQTAQQSLAAFANKQSDDVVLQRSISGDVFEIGNQYYKLHRPADALKAFSDAAAIDKTLFSKAPADRQAQSDIWRDLFWVGAMMIATQNDYDGALKQFRDALAAATALAAAEPTNVAWPHEISTADDMIGEALMSQNKLDGALAALNDAAGVAQRSFDSKNPLAEPLADDLWNVGQSYGRLSFRFTLNRQFDKALSTANTAIALAPNDLWIQANRAYALMFLGQTDAARAVYLQYRGQKVGDATWEDNVKADFANLRKQGLTNPLMDEIEKDFAPVAKNAAGGKGT